MDFSKLNQNERMASIGAAVAIVAGLVGFSYSVTILAVIFAIGLLVVVFLPQFSPTTNLPGSKGSLMLVTGGGAAVLLVLALLVAIGIVFVNFSTGDLFFLIAVAGGLVAGWFSWQEFQAEGGKFQLGTAAAPSGAAPPAAAPDATPAPTEPPSAGTAPPPASAAPPPSSAAPPPAAAAEPPAPPQGTTTEEDRGNPPA